MRRQVAVILWLCVLMAACGGSSGQKIGGATVPPPVISSVAAQNGAVIVTLTPGQHGVPVYYTTDGSTPTPTSQIYRGPFLVASNLTVKAISILDLATSGVVSQSFSPNIPLGTLVWSDQFANSTGANAQPDPTVWTYDTGNSGFGNQELEDYCAWNSLISPCNPANPNAYVGTDGYLHIVVQPPSAGVYTSARLKSQGLFSFQYGGLEFRALVPEVQDFWPAVWFARQ